MLDQVIIHNVLTLLENNLKASEMYLQQPSVVMAREDIHGCKEQRKPQNISGGAMWVGGCGYVYLKGQVYVIR